jgi:hypothetical protein
MNLYRKVYSSFCRNRSKLNFDESALKVESFIIIFGEPLSTNEVLGLMFFSFLWIRKCRVCRFLFLIIFLFLVYIFLFKLI